jgi:hypothetical protein
MIRNTLLINNINANNNTPINNYENSKINNNVKKITNNSIFRPSLLNVQENGNETDF